MEFMFRPCELEMDDELYIQFLLEHHNNLNLPYEFAVKLSFLSSPLIAGKAMLILREEPYEVVGAAGFVFGTGRINMKISMYARSRLSLSDRSTGELHCFCRECGRLQV